MQEIFKTIGEIAIYAIIFMPVIIFIGEELEKLTSF